MYFVHQDHLIHVAMLPPGPDNALQDSQRSRTWRDQMIGRQMRMKQQANGTRQQDQPPDDMHNLTQETSHLLK
jgi:hypothetical protein